MLYRLKSYNCISSLSQILLPHTFYLLANSCIPIVPAPHPAHLTITVIPAAKSRQFVLPWLHSCGCCCFAVCGHAQRRSSLERFTKRVPPFFFSHRLDAGSSLATFPLILPKWPGLHSEANGKRRCSRQKRRSPELPLTS